MSGVTVQVKESKTGGVDTGQVMSGDVTGEVAEGCSGGRDKGFWRLNFRVNGGGLAGCHWQPGPLPCDSPWARELELRLELEVKKPCDGHGDLRPSTDRDS
eukprot:3669635-Rhodomonas_salina.1